MNTEDPTELNSGPAKLTQRSRELFDAQVANQDARTRSRLNQARQAALDVARQQQRASRYGLGARWLLPAGSAAALALVAVTAVNIMRSAAEHPLASELVASNVDTSNINDVEILASDTELDLLQDMEFYAWLETQSPTADVASSEAG